MGSACDICAKPGACCSGFRLAHPALNSHDTIEGVTAALQTLRSAMVNGMPCSVGPAMTSTPEQRVYEGVPFRPLFKDRHGTWIMWCTNLTREGRCGDYDNRPPTCISFEAGEAGICVHHIPKHGLCTERSVTPNYKRPQHMHLNQHFWRKRPAPPIEGGEKCQKLPNSDEIRHKHAEAA
jgi:Fe-S-cluster containining protein